MSHDDEKLRIEKLTADAFIELYNTKMGTAYKVKEHLDAPDVRCEDCNGNKLNLEITLTEDRKNDIAAALGRSESRNLESLKTNGADCLQSNVKEMIVERIKRKIENNYGPNVALVVKDISPIGWDWSAVVGDIRAELSGSSNPFERGIWILTSLELIQIL